VIRQHDYRDALSPAWRYLAEALLGKGDLEGARHAATTAVRHAEESGNPRDQAWALWTQARAEQACGRRRKADSLAERARTLAAQIGDLSLQEAMEEGQFE
jgi:hypothetical protein